MLSEQVDDLAKRCIFDTQRNGFAVKFGPDLINRQRVRLIVRSLRYGGKCDQYTEHKEQADGKPACVSHDDLRETVNT